MVGKTCCWVHDDCDISKLVVTSVLKLSAWQVTETKAASPAALYLANNRKPLTALPPYPALQTSAKPVSLLEASANTAFRGLTKAFVKKLDREEVEALTTETSLAEMLVAMVKKVKKITIDEAIAIVSQRCVFQDVDERAAILQSEEAEEILHDKEKKEVEDMLESEVREENLTKELSQQLREIRESKKDAGPPAANKC